MTTAVLAGFLIAHGLVHLAVWLPHPDPDPAKPPPFAPDHSAVLTVASVTTGTSRRLASALATAAAIAFVVTGLAVAVGGDWVVPVAVVASAVGLTLKALFFNPWLTLGVLLDLGVLTAALFSWPVSLT